VVIGGGLLGLEAANGLKLRGMDVTVVHLGPWLLERQLDEVAGKMLQKSLEDKGLKFLLQTQTEALIQGESGRVARSASRTAADSGRPGGHGCRHPPNYALAEASGIYCNRGIVVNDTMQTYDPKVYAVGECVSHRGIAYGLVAPLFEQAKVAANHLAGYGIGRYTGSVTSTKLKVTGIDLFSAGDYMGGKDTEEIVLNDPHGGVQEAGDQGQQAGRRRDVRRHGRRPVVLPAAQGQARHPRHPRHLIFGQSLVGDVGHAGNSKAAGMPDSAEVCGCNGVTRAPSSRRSRRRACSRWTRSRSTPRRPPPAAPAPAWSSRSWPRPSAAPTPRRRSTEAGLRLHRPFAQEGARCHRGQHLTSKEAVFKAWNGRRRTAATSAARLNYYLISTWPHEAKDDPQSRFINERAHANIQKDGTYSVVPRMWGGLTTPPNCAPSPMPPRSTTCRPSR
jgi:nitrite reductase (NADH) large subunit